MHKQSRKSGAAVNIFPYSMKIALPYKRGIVILYIPGGLAP